MHWFMKQAGITFAAIFIYRFVADILLSGYRSQAEILALFFAFAVGSVAEHISWQLKLRQ